LLIVCAKGKLSVAWRDHLFDFIMCTEAQMYLFTHLKGKGPRLLLPLNRFYGGKCVAVVETPPDDDMWVGEDFMTASGWMPHAYVRLDQVSNTNQT
jgi:hypothetical protein